MSALKLRIGNEEKWVEAQTVDALLKEFHLPEDGKGIAIAVNDTVVSKSRWSEYELHDEDRIEIVKAVQGG